jgi:hypothetical protein
MTAAEMSTAAESPESKVKVSNRIGNQQNAAGTLDAR